MTDAVIEVFGDEFTDIDAIGGLTMGGDPMAYGVAAVAATRGHDLRSFSVRKEAKQGGITGRIAGALIAGDRVLVTEDTTTRGTSLIEAAERWRPTAPRPVWMTVIVDRGGTCAAMAAERRHRLPPPPHRPRPRLRLRHLSPVADLVVRSPAVTEIAGRQRARTPGLRMPSGSRRVLDGALRGQVGGRPDQVEPRGLGDADAVLGRDRPAAARRPPRGRCRRDARCRRCRGS